MRVHTGPGRLLGAAWLTAVLLAACAPGAGGTGSRAAGPAAPPAVHDAVFLDRGECAAGDLVGSYREVVCSDPSARARVATRLYGLLPASPSPAPPAATRAGDRCPPTTDFLLTVIAARPQGYACMRNLRAPHPGDPGGGGGPRTIAGDCVYTSRKGRVKEARCDGSGPHAPRFRVVELARSRRSCPRGTALYVVVGAGPAGVGCARRL